VRAFYLLVYAGFAALGEALVARPAAAWLRGRGLLRAALPWDVPLGVWAVLLAVALAAFTLALSLRFALGFRARVPLHAAFLGLIALSFAVRGTAGEPQPPKDPTAPLLDGLRTAAAALDSSYSGRYLADARALDAALSKLPRPGFRRRFRELPLRVHLLGNATAAQLTPLYGDEPGTLYVALAADGKRAWLSALTLRAGEPAVLRQTVQATAGTHSLPGRDALVPAYPGMQHGKDR
jgi:hypothetical protein